MELPNMDFIVRIWKFYSLVGVDQKKMHSCHNVDWNFKAIIYSSAYVMIES